MLISTAFALLPILTGRMPANVSGRETRRSKWRDKVVARLRTVGRVGLARMFSIFLPMNVAIGIDMMTAAFLAAAISAVVELGAAVTSFGIVAEVRCVHCLELLIPNVIAVRVTQQHDVQRAPSRGSSDPVTDWPAS